MKLLKCKQKFCIIYYSVLAKVSAYNTGSFLFFSFLNLWDLTPILFKSFS